MNTHKPVVAYSLDGQIELFIQSRSNQILRTVSFNEGETWLEWITMTNHKTRRSVGFASTADSHRKVMAYQILNPAEGTGFEDRFKDSSKYVLKTAGRYGFDWDDVSEPMDGDGRFLSGPSVLRSPNGVELYIFGRGLDNKIYWARTDNKGITWLWLWAKIGDAVYKSEPASVMSADGETIMLFTIGMDDRCYFSRSTDAGKTWNPYAGPIKQGLFTSGPSACISADGKEVMVAARGRDDRIYYIRSENKGNSWKGDWAPILSGVFDSGPGLCANWDLSKIFVFAVGRDNKIWKAHAIGENAPFAGWWTADKLNKLTAI